ncbi:hypothetical protein EG327_007221 [Venturia inaequalis]|uniref:Uncharacterized protein n=1 Tax=Venturia inaequalis TaxID=5025 RepID=A0A8H3VU19_VENIN|nr:hypothetical protein EG327_007221 [Venturia inaequalis]
MSYWASQIQTGNASTVDQRFRPQGFGLFNENITVNGSWIHTIDTKKVSEKFGRAINNVTLAMPHSGVVQAGWDSKNNIIQPSDLDSIGIYNIRAAVPSPYVNVLCANAAEAELAPLIYEKQRNVALNTTLDLANLSTHWYTESMNWTEFNSVKSTPLDEVFGWAEPSDRPAFYKLPIKFNTILNNTRPKYHRDSLYLLGTGDTTGYFICKIKGGTTPICSTEYSATGNNGNLKAKCDLDDSMAFNKKNTSRVETTSFDWWDVGQTALTAMSLNSGVTDGASANARLLTQLMLKDDALNPALPSPAEALAVMIGCTLLMSADGSPFVEFWNYTVATLNPGEYQSFDALFQGQEYASGGVLPYQKAFHLVLIPVFLLNLFVLAYLLIHKGLVTDFSEPPNLFSLAVNSPPSTLLAGSCGGGPHGRQYEVNWAIQTEGEHLYMTNRKDDKGNVKNTGYSPVGGDGDGARDLDQVELGHIPRTTTGSAPTTPATPGSANRMSRHGSKFGRAYSAVFGSHTQDYKFDPLLHLPGISPYFDAVGAGLKHKAPTHCEVTAASYLVRHAAIYAQDTDYETYIEPLLKKIDTTFALSGKKRKGWTGPFEFLDKWETPIPNPKNQLEQITPQGIKDSMKVAKHLLARYPTLVPTTRRIYADKKSRTKDTAKAFVAVFPQVVDVVEIKLNESSHSQIPHKACNAFSKEPGDEQMKRFLSHYGTKTISRLQQYSPVELELNDIVGLQQLCGYESAIRGKMSKICDAFNDDEWMAYEYMMDMKYYFMVGHGNPLSPYLGFPWLNTTAEVMKKFHAPHHTASTSSKSKMPDEDAQRFFISFTHREVPPVIATALGLFNSSSHSSEEFPTDRINWSRSWRMADLVPFLGHVGIEKLSCQGLTAKDDEPKEFIRVIANTSPTPIPACQDGPGASCSIDEFFKLVERGMETYGDFDGICKNKVKRT